MTMIMTQLTIGIVHEMIIHCIGAQKYPGMHQSHYEHLKFRYPEIPLPRNNKVFIVLKTEGM